MSVCLERSLSEQHTGSPPKLQWNQSYASHVKHRLSLLSFAYMSCVGHKLRRPCAAGERRRANGQRTRPSAACKRCVCVAACDGKNTSLTPQYDKCAHGKRTKRLGYDLCTRVTVFVCIISQIRPKPNAIHTHTRARSAVHALRSFISLLIRIATHGHISIWPSSDASRFCLLAMPTMLAQRTG